MKTVKLVTTEEVEQFMVFAEGFHHLDWGVLRAVIGKFQGVDQEQAFDEAVGHWVDRLRDDLGGAYHVCDEGEIVLLSERPEKEARWLARYSDGVLGTIREQLGAAAWRGVRVRKVLIAFSEEDDYYPFVSYYSPDGEQATSGGMYIDDGCPIVPFTWMNQAEAANTVVHELTHHCLGHLPLPLWLNEGITMSVQRRIAPPQLGLTGSDHDAFWAAASNWTAPVVWQEIAERHFEFWNEQNIQSFWSGMSFSIAGDSNELSYNLAEVLVKLLLEGKNAEQFVDFVQRAQARDGGAEAARAILNADLGEVAGTFLGRGNWRPDRGAIARDLDAAGWNSDRG